MYNTFLTIGLVFIALMITFTSLLALCVADVRRKKSLRRDAKLAENAIVFLFDDTMVADATPLARQMLSSERTPGAVSDWNKLEKLLEKQFPKLTSTMADLAELGKITLTSEDGATNLIAAWSDGLARVELVGREDHAPVSPLDQLGFDALSLELDSLRATTEHVPLMVWRENANGAITWANKSYLDLAADPEISGHATGWPPRNLFNLKLTPKNINQDASQRVAIELPNRDSRNWFEIHTAPLGDEILYTAIPADEVVKAETSRAEFITTLTKTFAHLPIGLAIFDHKRQLALFNPALTDLVNLPVDFLVAKPSLSAFLDRLRENRMMPEPKDYISWRQQMSDLEAAATNGTYEETWSLPTGLTYRVTGRPHPDGAVAFLIEDISAEISLTRRFRTELEIGQSALDCMDEAIAIFTAGGVLAMSNTAYDDLWEGNPSAALGDLHIGDAINRWRKTSIDSGVWQELKEYTALHGDRQPWKKTVHLTDGRLITCRATPMVRGATMVRFVTEEAGFAQLRSTGQLQAAKL